MNSIINRRSIILIAGVILTSLSMRGPLAGIGPLTELIQIDLSLSHSQIGLLTTLPLICFAFLSVFTAGITKKFGIEPTIIGASTFLTFGILLRSSGPISVLYLGTLFIGIGIALLNVLLPSLVKKEYPENKGAMTSLYSGFMGIGATIGAGLSIPIANITTWEISLGSWVLIALISLSIWLVRSRINGLTHAVTKERVSFKQIGKNGLAWQIALYMGFQSFIFYVILAWLPDILIEKGISSDNAGWLLSLSQGTGILGSIILPIFADKFKNQRLIISVISVIQICSILGLFSSNLALMPLWIGLIGFSLGSSFSLALLFMVLRTTSAEITTGLSGMAQSVGYFIAAFGPVLLGWIHDIYNNWTIPLYVLIFIAVLQFIAGVGAGRARQISL